MAGRRLVWSDKHVQLAAASFVTAADEVWRLQRGTDPECRHFQHMAQQGHYPGLGTKQGIYVCTAAGNLLASINSLDAQKVLATLELGLSRWKSLPESHRHLPANSAVKPTHRWESNAPADGLILRAVVGDLLEPAADGDQRVPRTNIDHVWFSKEEVQRWLPRHPRVGERYALPMQLVERLARFHLVDNARGQTLPFARHEVSGSFIRVEVFQIDGSQVQISFVGETRCYADGTWHLGDNDWKPDRQWPRAIATRLQGTAVFDLKTNRFRSFGLIAIGNWRGKTRFNGRHQETGTLGWIFQIAPDRPADRIAPGFVDVYNADWITPPPRSRK